MRTSVGVRHAGDAATGAKSCWLFAACSRSKVSDRYGVPIMTISSSALSRSRKPHAEPVTAIALRSLQGYRDRCVALQSRHLRRGDSMSFPRLRTFPRHFVGSVDWRRQSSCRVTGMYSLFSQSTSTAKGVDVLIITDSSRNGRNRASLVTFGDERSLISKVGKSDMFPIFFDDIH